MEKIIVPFLRLIASFKKSDEAVDIVATLSTAKSVLVLMPDKLEHFGIARQFVKQIKKEFPQARLTFVTRESYQNLLEPNSQYGTIFVTSQDINYLGLPKKKLQEKIVATNCDVVIDLNYDFHLLSTYLCQKSGAALKICLDDRMREPFYNIYFRSDVQKNLDEKYRGLLNYLSNCKQTTDRNSR